ncbi:MAG: hypothetical protein JOY59_11765, partial [Candidatus Eremiobacteraeota bacterium]|nr:hypothetical protein [Candidatus Eremiobacteraeota bacterium]
FSNGVALSGNPTFTFVLPGAFATGGVSFYLALLQGPAWSLGYGGPGSVSGSTVTIGGNFALAFGANQAVCFALYAQSIFAPTPPPATPAPTSTPSTTPSPTPSATASGTPMASVMPTASAAPTASASSTSTATASPTPSPSPTQTSSGTSGPPPAPTPTPSPAPIASPSSLSFLGVGASLAQDFTVSESGYMGTFTAMSLAPSVASVSTLNGLTFTVTPLAAGTTSILVTDSLGRSTSVPVSVTITIIPIN